MYRNDFSNFNNYQTAFLSVIYMYKFIIILKLQNGCLDIYSLAQIEIMLHVATHV